jgi:hypothetical protein
MFSFYSKYLPGESIDKDQNIGDLLRFTAKDKLPALLSDVIGLDLSKYTLIDHGYGTRYDYGGRVYVENYSAYLVDEEGGEVSVQSMFYNGFPDWLLITPLAADGVYVKHAGSLYYAIEPPNGSVADLQNVFERYVAFAQKYDIVTLEVSSVLDLFSQAPKDLPLSVSSPVKVYSDDKVLYVSQKSFGFGYVIDGVEVVNKSMGITFSNNQIQFHDDFELYTVCSSGLFSKEELTNFAFDVAKKWFDDFFSSVNDGSSVKPVLSKANADVSLVVIPGQLHNNELNDALLEAGVGTSYSVKRDALTLYPFLSATFYLNKPVGNVNGVQVSVWGDTQEVTSCYEHMFRTTWYGVV